MSGKTPFRVGEMVAAPFLDDHSYYRAQVMEIEEDKLDLYFVDYGDSEFVEKSDVYPLR